jgi:pyruvate carboxylase
MGLWHRWEEVLDAYRDSNRVLGDIIKVWSLVSAVLMLLFRSLLPPNVLEISLSIWSPEILLRMISWMNPKPQQLTFLIVLLD